MARCACGFPERWSKDPRSPWKPAGDGYALLGRWTATSCFWCGGDFGTERAPRPADDRGCECLKAHDKDATSPLKFDEIVWEYGLRFLAPVDGSCVVRFCPFCSAAAPPSRRGDLFAKPGDEECRRVLALVEGAVTVEDVVARLGLPDWQAGWVRPDAAPGTDGGARCTLHYRKLSDAAVLVVTEWEPGIATCSTQGAYIGPTRNRR